MDTIPKIMLALAPPAAALVLMAGWRWIRGTFDRKDHHGPHHDPR